MLSVSCTSLAGIGIGCTPRAQPGKYKTTMEILQSAFSLLLTRQIFKIPISSYIMHNIRGLLYYFHHVFAVTP
jgi:hypothetical protein